MNKSIYPLMILTTATKMMQYGHSSHTQTNGSKTIEFRCHDRNVHCMELTCLFCSHRLTASYTSNKPHHSAT